MMLFLSPLNISLPEHVRPTTKTTLLITAEHPAWLSVYVRCVRRGGLHINGFHTWRREGRRRLFENERQSDAGGGDRAGGNLDSPVVYL